MQLVKSLYSSFAGIPPMFIDGLIAISIVFLCFWESTFGGDEAAKYVEPKTLFYLKNIIGSFAVTLVGLQSFRSKSYANHLNDKEATKDEPPVS